MSNKETTCKAVYVWYELENKDNFCLRFYERNSIVCPWGTRRSPSKNLLARNSFVKISIIVLPFSPTLFCTQFVLTMYFESSYILVAFISTYTVSQFHTAYGMKPLQTRLIISAHKHLRRLFITKYLRNQSLVSRKHLDVSVWAEEVFGFIDIYLRMIQSYLWSSRAGMLQISDEQCYPSYVTMQSFCCTHPRQLRYCLMTFVLYVFKAFDTAGSCNKIYIKTFKHAVSISQRTHHPH